MITLTNTHSKGPSILEGLFFDPTGELFISRESVSMKKGDIFLFFINTDFSKVEGFVELLKFAGIECLKESEEFEDITLQEKALILFQKHRGHIERAQATFKSNLEIYLKDRELSDPMTSEDLHGWFRFFIAPVKVQYDFIKNPNKNTNTLATIIHTNDIITLAYFDFYSCIADSAFLRCPFCGKIDNAKNKSNEKYCSSCKSVSYGRKINGNISKELYNEAYKTRHKEKQRNIKKPLPKKMEAKNTKIWTDAFDKWVLHAKKKQKDFDNGLITELEYRNSLKITVQSMI